MRQTDQTFNIDKRYQVIEGTFLEVIRSCKIGMAMPNTNEGTFVIILSGIIIPSYYLSALLQSFSRRHLLQFNCHNSVGGRPRGVRISS